VRGQPAEGLLPVAQQSGVRRTQLDHFGHQITEFVVVFHDQDMLLFTHRHATFRLKLVGLFSAIRSLDHPRTEIVNSILIYVPHRKREGFVKKAPKIQESGALGREGLPRRHPHDTRKSVLLEAENMRLVRPQVNV
jgi:hypothetical protein